MARNSEHRTMVVERRRDLAEDVIELRLAPVGGGPAPVWEPGAHVDVVLPSGVIRQYSISGGDDDSLTIGVLRQPDGRGGSVELFERLHEGSLVEVAGPRNHFRLVEAAEYVFIAGGIGITPVLAMIRSAASRGVRWSLVYGGRTRTTMAYLDELAELLAASGPGCTVRVVPEDEHGLIDIAAAFGSADSSVPVYACGPEPLLAALESYAAEVSVLERLHLERFAGKAVDADDDRDDGALSHFEVELAVSGAVLPIGPEDRIIDVVRTRVPGMPFSCEEGYCGSCETGVLAGTPCHRDQILSPEERAANDVMMICVGRSRSERLVLEL